MKKTYILGFMFSLGLLAGCRGTTSELPPVHPNLNMDFQEKYIAQRENPLFADGRAMRTPVKGTVARGRFFGTDAEVVLHTGKDAAGNFVAKNPLPITEDLLKHGQNRFNIYCAPCHSQVGDGKGIVATYGAMRSPGYVQPASYHQDRLRAETDGYFFGVVSNGVNTMAGYASQLPDVQDRWAIVAYVRALQRSQYADASQVPASELATLKANAPAVSTTPAAPATPVAPKK